MKHTPGPWTVDKTARPHGLQLTVRDSQNCFITELDSISRLEDNEANAHLIAAAPELLDAAKCWLDLNILPSCEPNSDFERRWRLARAQLEIVIAKATKAE